MLGYILREFEAGKVINKYLYSPKIIKCAFKNIYDRIDLIKHKAC
jgi:hypothetical protein